jgi:DNA mismatch repair protein MLH3
LPRADFSGRVSRKSGAGAILSGLNQPSGVVIALETRELADRHVATAAMSIKPLPGNVVAQIKSSTVITSLNGVAYGLVQNSLDAQASRINLSVDYRRGNCTVEDNGQGIPPLYFHEDGGLGKLYCTCDAHVMLFPPSHRSFYLPDTSRYPPRADRHGRHGTFLASLGALSLMTITSHHHEYRSHNSLTIHNSKVVVRDIPAKDEQRFLQFPSGTHVAVRDLFGSMPVRVKQRASETERLGSARNFEQLLLSLVPLLLAWAGDVTLHVRDASESRPRVIVLRPPPTPSNHVNRTAALLSQAALAEPEDSSSWIQVGANAPGISVSGCVSTLPAAAKRIQFIAFGVQPLRSESNYGLLHDEINRVFVNSAFGSVEEPSLDEARTKESRFTQRELKARKGVDRWPMFFLRIDLDQKMEAMDTDTLLDERGARLATIVDLLQVMAYEFLKKHHFRPRPVNAFQALKMPTGSSSRLGRSQSDSPSSTADAERRPTKQPRLSSKNRTASSKGIKGLRDAKQGAQSPFASWSKVKSSSASSESNTLKGTWSTSGTVDAAEAAGPVNWNPLFEKSGKLLRKPFDDVEEDSALKPSIRSVSGDNENTGTIAWIDPATKKRALIDPRTGFMGKPPSNQKPEASRPQSNRNIHLPITLPPKHAAHVFQPTEPAIPCVSQIPESFGRGESGAPNSCRDLGGVNADLPSGQTSKTLENRISKDALRNCEVLGQVDRKFILVKIFFTGSTAGPRRFVLVLIDQHAADERCRVEELTREYFAPADNGSGWEARTDALDRPLRFDLSRQDGALLVRFREHFLRWGIVCEVFHREGDQRRVTAEVHSLPPSIVARCRAEPRLLVELLRKEAWRVQEQPGMAVVKKVDIEEGEFDWVARFNRCPEGVVEMINSRACRSKSFFLVSEFWC